MPPLGTPQGHPHSSASHAPSSCHAVRKAATVAPPVTNHYRVSQVPRWLVLDLTLVSFVDSTGAAVLKQLHRDLQPAGVTLCLASASGKGHMGTRGSGIYKGLDGPHMAALVNLLSISYNRP